MNSSHSPGKQSFAILSSAAILGNGREALPLQHSEIEPLRAGLKLRRAEPHPYLNIGERARILRGPLEGFEGIVERRNNGLWVVLTLQEIMKSCGRSGRA